MSSLLLDCNKNNVPRKESSFDFGLFSFSLSESERGKCRCLNPVGRGGGLSNAYASSSLKFAGMSDAANAYGAVDGATAAAAGAEQAASVPEPAGMIAAFMFRLG